ncbi:MAG: tetratricopeptide repeat protein [Polyangiales bacterium]|nr:tetratricopeptide repeat protein [Myxococcales bacterium]MCB9658988.1 tetratricopeptide repeat protein [Sandaracinaceae bacterium]
MSERGQPTIRELQLRAERALSSGRRADIERALIDLAREAPVGSDSAIFAHRHLAELHLEDNPWRAALHLRRAIDAGHPRHGDVLHALMGLCQALLGNYAYAARCYRRALGFAPGTPWYHHNLGHLLDVGLDDLVGAEQHLRVAYEQEPLHDEVVASLAHCLARRGKLVEALVLAREAVALAPRHKEHRSLQEWIEQGAPAKRPRAVKGVMGRVGSVADGAIDDAVEDMSGCEDEFTESVAALLVDQMIAGGFDPDDINCARDVLDDYIGLRDAVGRPDVLAAAVEYTVSQLRGLGLSQQNIADRYGVTRGAVGHRSRDIRTTLSLSPYTP